MRLDWFHSSATGIPQMPVAARALLPAIHCPHYPREPQTVPTGDESFGQAMSLATDKRQLHVRLELDMPLLAGPGERN